MVLFLSLSLVRFPGRRTVTDASNETGISLRIVFRAVVSSLVIFLQSVQRNLSKTSLILKKSEHIESFRAARGE